MTHAQHHHDEARARALLIALKQRSTWPALSERTGIDKSRLIGIATGDTAANFAEQTLFRVIWNEENQP
tara:strand:- start:37 stop:243 length:207 start_codon:yes stop_codon:yes gene_type:complete